MFFKRLIVFFGACFLPIENMLAQEISSISLPISIDLTLLEKRINSEIPQQLATINEPGRVCVKAKWLKTKSIPKCSLKGIKIYCKDRWLKTKVTPKIRCDLKGHVKRNGPIKLGGNGNSIQLSFPVYSKVSAKAAGIRETVDAKATIFLGITLDINSDWSVSAKLKSDMRWDQRPTLKLFGIIKITIGSRVEPALRNKMNEFAKSIPDLLNNLNIRSEIEKAWSTIQDPLQISKSPLTYLVFRPTEVGFSGVNISNNKLDFLVEISGKTSAFIGNLPSIEKVELLPLQKIERYKGKFSVDIPVFASFVEIEGFLKSKFPNVRTIEISDGDLKGTIRLSNLNVSGKKGGHVNFSMHIDYDNRSEFLKYIDIFDWFDVSGKVSFNIRPMIDAKNSVMYFDKLEIIGSTNNKNFDTLAKITRIPLVNSYIKSLLKYNYETNIINAIKELNESINVQLKNGINISGDVERGELGNFKIDPNGISLNVKAKGNAKLSIDVIKQ